AGVIFVFGEPALRHQRRGDQRADAPSKLLHGVACARPLRAAPDEDYRMLRSGNDVGRFFDLGGIWMDHPLREHRGGRLVRVVVATPGVRVTRAQPSAMPSPAPSWRTSSILTPPSLSSSCIQYMLPSPMMPKT